MSSWKSRLRLFAGPQPGRFQNIIDLLEVGLWIISLTRHKIRSRLSHSPHNASTYNSSPTHAALTIEPYLLVQSTSKQLVPLQISIHILRYSKRFCVLIAYMNDLPTNNSKNTVKQGHIVVSSLLPPWAASHKQSLLFRLARSPLCVKFDSSPCSFVGLAPLHAARRIRCSVARRGRIRLFWWGLWWSFLEGLGLSCCQSHR